LKALISTSNKRTERVFLIAAELKSRTAWEVRDSLDELAELAATAGAEVIGDGTQKLEAPLPRPSLAAARPTNSPGIARATRSIR